MSPSLRLGGGGGGGRGHNHADPADGNNGLTGNQMVVKCKTTKDNEGQWLSGRVLDLRPRGCGFEPHWCHCVVSLSKTHLYLNLVLVQPWKTHPDITGKLLTGTLRIKSSNKKKKNKALSVHL